MKKLKLVLGGILLHSSLGFGQTNVIALKSHAGTVDELLSKKDNFGLRETDYLYLWVDSVEYVKKEKIVVRYGTDFYDNTIRDTLNYQRENDTIIQEHLKATRLNNWYPERTKFIGFPTEIEKMAEDRYKIQQNAIPFWFVLSFLGLGSVFIRRKVD